MVRTLWVDDNIRDYGGLVDHLRASFRVTLDTASSVDEAVKMLAENQYKLLMFDLALPSARSKASLIRQSGTTVLSAAISEGVGEFIAFTVLAESEVKSELDHLGAAYRFVNKATSLRALLTAIESSVDSILGRSKES